MAAFDVDAVRARFPALSLEQDGRPIAFFDGPGGTQVPQSVIDAVSRYYRESNANADGAFPTSRRSDAIVAVTERLTWNVSVVMFGPNLISSASAAPSMSAIAWWASWTIASLRRLVRNAPSALAFDSR